MLARFARYGPVNSHDAIKLIALIGMTVDHIGAYLLVDELWLRALGRITIPVWFFLIGYARGDRITLSLMIGATLALAMSAITGFALLPLNVLFSIILCRLALQLCQSRGWITRYPAELVALSIALFLPTMFLFEYGAVGIGFALLGRMLREGMQGRRLAIFWGVVTLFYMLTQLPGLGDIPLQAATVILGTALVSWRLYYFRITPVSMPSLPGKATMLLARYSLEYYVLHRAALQLIGAFMLGTHH